MHETHIIDSIRDEMFLNGIGDVADLIRGNWSLITGFGENEVEDAGANPNHSDGDDGRDGHGAPIHAETGLPFKVIQTIRK